MRPKRTNGVKANYLRRLAFTDNTKNSRWRTFELGWSLGLYDDLDSTLDSRGMAMPVIVSLGTSVYDFMRREDGSSIFRLPGPAHDFVQEAGDEGFDPVREVWLGIDDTYVVQTRSGQLRWQFKGHYGILDNILTYSSKIKALGLNLENNRSYWAVASDGSIIGNPTGTGVTKAVFESWV